LETVHPGYVEKVKKSQKAKKVIANLGRKELKFRAFIKSGGLFGPRTAGMFWGFMSCQFNCHPSQLPKKLHKLCHYVSRVVIPEAGGGPK
jgi:hypothetical protein